jgi:hypothetical protein
MGLIAGSLDKAKESILNKLTNRIRWNSVWSRVQCREEIRILRLPKLCVHHVTEAGIRFKTYNAVMVGRRALHVGLIVIHFHTIDFDFDLSPFSPHESIPSKMFFCAVSGNVGWSFASSTNTYARFAVRMQYVTHSLTITTFIVVRQ